MNELILRNTYSKKNGGIKIIYRTVHVVGHLHIAKNRIFFLSFFFYVDVHVEEQQCWNYALLW